MFGLAEVPGLVRERDFLRGLTLVYTATVYTHAPTYCTESKCLIGVFSAAFVHYCGRQMVRSRNEFSRRFTKLIQSHIYRPGCFSLLSASLAASGGCQSRRDVPSREGVDFLKFLLLITQIDQLIGFNGDPRVCFPSL